MSSGREFSHLQSLKLRHEEKLKTIDAVMFAETTKLSDNQSDEKVQPLSKEDTKRKGE